MKHFYFGIISQSLAFEAEAAMAHHGFVTRERAAKIQRARQDLPTAPSFVDKVSFAERLELLDIASRAPRKNISFSRILTGQDAQTASTQWAAGVRISSLRLCGRRRITAP